MKDDEFVAAQSRDAIPFAQTVCQPIRNRLEQKITHGMSQGVVYFLEVIRLRKLLAEKLRGENADLRKRLKLD
ncbi:hypothetical protein [Rhizobium changzhiense]|uniref:hypothetical protein n=1 Tax=Rhizobium changzhiense TaxID=2692317 RepID=UPI002467B8E5|nr:hypothetical protein [Rhizobium changzhiense]